jgi:PilZ domain
VEDALVTIATRSIRELRVNLQLDVRAWGLDSAGKPFTQAAKTVEISASGARLQGINAVQPTDIIGVQYGDQKARFRVAWVGERGTDREGQIGIESIDTGKCIWLAVLQQSAATNTLQDLPETTSDRNREQPEGTWPQVNRRRHSRYSCVGSAALSTPTSDVLTTVKLSDISLSGCYIETMSPLSIDRPVSLTALINDCRCMVEGVVRTCHPGMGNGIAFTKIEPHDWEKLAKLINNLSGGAAVGQQTDINIGEPLEVLISMLQKKGILTYDEFVEELKKSLYRDANTR